MIQNEIVQDDLLAFADFQIQQAERLHASGIEPSAVMHAGSVPFVRMQPDVGPGLIFLQAGDAHFNSVGVFVNHNYRNSGPVPLDQLQTIRFSAYSLHQDRLMTAIRPYSQLANRARPLNGLPGHVDEHENELVESLLRRSHLANFYSGKLLISRL